MADEFKDIIDQLAKDVSAEAKMSLADAQALVATRARDVIRWEAQARQAIADGKPDLAVKKRHSIEEVKNAAILDLAIHGVEVTNKVERAILAAFDKAIGMAAKI